MENIKITLPDGSVKEVDLSGTTAYQVAESISGRLAKEALVAKADGKYIDLHSPLKE
jgi:threonyl-tRNA synthetase